MTELILVRHGITEANRAGVYCGRLDLPLADEALEEVSKTADILSSFRPCRVCCSTALRARQTAELIVPDIDIVCLQSLQEMDFGAFEGLGADEIQNRMPNAWQAYMADYMNFTFPGGDNVRNYLTNASKTIKGIIREAGDGSVLVVSHKGYILSVLSYLLHGDNEHIFCYDIRPAGFARLSVCDGYAVFRQLY